MYILYSYNTTTMELQFMKLKSIFLSTFIITAFVIISCGGGTSGGAKTVTIGVPTDPVILDPPMYSELVTHSLNYEIYNRLFELSDNGLIVPDLAKDMPLIEENGTLYTISIKEGIKFHNGSPLTIDDVIYSFQRGAFSDKSQMKSIYAMMYDMKKIDDYTFSFRTGKLKAGSTMKDSDIKSFEERSKYYEPASFGSQLNQLSWLGASILDKETMEKAEKEGTAKDYGITWAIGTGPYVFQSWDQGDKVVFTRNTNYYAYNKDSNIDTIVFKTIKDPSALKTSFMTKEVDVLASIDPIDVNEIEKQGGSIISPNGYYGYHYMSFNMKSPLVGQVNANGTPDMDGTYDLNSDQAKLRMAIVYSINPADINNSVDIMNKMGKISRQFIESLPYGKITNAAGTRLEEGNDETGYYNPQKAREIFAALPDSFKKEGSVKLTVLSGSIYVKEAIIIKDQIKKILGVDLINIQQVAQSELINRRVMSDPKVWDLLVYNTNTDDSYYIFVAYNGFNTSVLHDTRYYDKNAQKWIEEGNILPNGPDRDNAYRNASIEILKAMPRLPLVAYRSLAAAQNNISGITISPSGTLKLYKLVKQ